MNKTNDKTQNDVLHDVLNKLRHEQGRRRTRRQRLAGGPYEMHGAGGQATVFVLVLFPALLLCGGLVLDGGLALAAGVRLYGDTDAAARAAAQQLDLIAYRTTGRLRLDPDRARAAARRSLQAAGDSGQITVTGSQVTVTATTVVPTHLFALAGVDRLHVHASGSAHPVRGPGPA